VRAAGRDSGAGLDEHRREQQFRGERVTRGAAEQVRECGFGLPTTAIVRTA
jgi:hypothetical protein